ncbi:hypothetical protein, partial [Rhodanobacter sp. FW104-R8]|uniref:hypothetical protein n=2 Tax=Rhodanobacter TaxID=75309 RepID=UPI001F429FD0
ASGVDSSAIEANYDRDDPGEFLNSLLGALTFLYNKHPAATLVPLLVLGYLSLVFYFGAFFLKHRITIPGVHSKALQDLLSGFLAIALGFGANRLVQLAVSAFSIGTP